MTRPGLLLGVLTLALLVAGTPPSPAGASEAEAPIDPAEVGALLLSPDAQVRARGETLLLARIARGGDLAPFVREMAEVQAALVADRDAVRAAWVREALERDGEARERAERRLRALGPQAVARLRAERAARQAASEPVEPVPPPAPVPPAAEPEAAPPGPPSAPAPAATRRVEAVLVDVPWLEMTHLLGQEARRVAAALGEGDVLGLEQGRPLARVGLEARDLMQAIVGLPDARTAVVDAAQRPLGSTWRLRDPEEVRYRRDLAPTDDGGWAVQAGGIPRGLAVEVLLVPRGEGLEATVDARFTEVGEPMAVRRIRPAPGVEPLDLDRPEWQTARATLTFEVPSDAGLAAVLFPMLVPERALLVALLVGDASADVSAPRLR